MTREVTTTTLDDIARDVLRTARYQPVPRILAWCDPCGQIAAHPDGKCDGCGAQCGPRERDMGWSDDGGAA